MAQGMAGELSGPARSFFVGAALSVVLHGILAVFLLGVPRYQRDAAALPLPWDELPASASHTDSAPADMPSEVGFVPLELGGPSSRDNVQGMADGSGGDGGGSADVTFLVSRSHNAHLQDSPLTASDRSQIQRIRTSRERASYENRRATPNPNDQPFLATGEGMTQQRRAPSRAESQRGALHASARSEGGAGDHSSAAGTSRRETATGADAERATSATARPSEAGSTASPGRGVDDGRGSVESPRARVATGRPRVDEGPAATLATEAARPNDNRDAEQLARLLVQSTVEASRRRGDGGGRGGAAGEGATGHGQSDAEGGTALAHQPGPGSGGLDTSSRRYRGWYLRARRQVENALVFPRARMVAMDQGLAVFRLRVDRGGALAGQPRRMRSSGFSDMDQAALNAIVQSAPFEPIPDDIAAGQSSLSIDMTVEFANPMVH